MIILKGKYNEAIVYTDSLENEAAAQIINLCNQKFAAEQKIRVMPDVHSGVGCVIGLTSTVGNWVIPNLIGVDIGCGMLSFNLGKTKVSFEGLDRFIRRHIPSGEAVNSQLDSYAKKYLSTDLLEFIDDVAKKTKTSAKRHQLSLGSLGSGNHFIELDVDTDNNLWLVIHSGSRHLGYMVCRHHQKIAEKLMNKNAENDRVPKDLAYLTAEHLKAYIHDMLLAQKFASCNRRVMAERIIDYLGCNVIDSFETIHNYYNIKDNIMRKGAISAHQGEKVLIPLNMRDGSVIAIGKGNPDWNYSAPHGAGRLYSRNEARKIINLEDFKKSMQGVWSTSINNRTLDEAPFVYKPAEEILRSINETVDIVDIIKPVYNFKAN